MSEALGENLTSRFQSRQSRSLEGALLYLSPVPGKQRSLLD